jgi:glycosyltransferase involved in cell wall biosynthesis
MDHPAVLVSIIITNYNYARFLADAIDSALAQSYPEVEVVVVDDGSTDESREIITGYGDRIVTVLQQNRGMGATYNSGLAASRGDVIIFLDSDDVILPEAVAEVIGCFDDGSVAKVHWPLTVIDTNGVPTSGREPTGELSEGDFLQALVESGPDAYLSPPTSGNAWRRSFLEKVLPMPEEEFRRHSDIYLCTLAPVYGSVKLIEKHLSHYRVHGRNDYACDSSDRKLARNLAIYGSRCAYLRHHLEKRGITADPARWMEEGSPYDWLLRLQKSIDIIRSIVPEGSSWVLVDGSEWAYGTSGDVLIEGRHTIPFTSREGIYWGPPVDDASAVEEIETRRAEGVGWIVFAQPAFWWLEFYGGMKRYLDEHYPLRHSSESLVIYELEERGV